MITQKDSDLICAALRRHGFTWDQTNFAVSLVRNFVEREARRSDECIGLIDLLKRMKADAAKQNKLMHLAAQDIVFFGGFLYDPDDREFRVPKPMILCSDFFAPAADCEEFEPEDIDEIHDAYLRFGEAGVLAWVSLKRGGAAPWRLKLGSEFTDQFEIARKALRSRQGYA
ncbi:MAG: hypothetical protein ACKO0Z_03550 [Betaproteobacteria bacterium]